MFHKSPTFWLCLAHGNLQICFSSTHLWNVWLTAYCPIVHRQIDGIQNTQTRENNTSNPLCSAHCYYFITALWDLKLYFVVLQTVSLWIFCVSSSKFPDRACDVILCVFTVDRTLCKWCMTGGGGHPDVNTVLLTLFTAAPHITVWQMGAEVDPYHSRHHPPHSALQCPSKNRLFSRQATFLMQDCKLFSLPLCCIDFLLTKTPISFLPQLCHLSQGWAIHLLHLHTVLVEQFSPSSLSIHLPDSWKYQETVLTEHLHIKVWKNALSANTRQTAEESVLVCRAVRGSHVSSGLEAWRKTA